MAIDGNEPPPLPRTDDPFVLLGVPPDADAKLVRQAYAKLIRIYRPDRSPAQFQRVHAAFEDAKQRLAGDAGQALAKLVHAARTTEPAPVKPEPEPEAEPEPEPEGSHDVEAEHKLAELKRRVAAREPAGALIEALIADRIPLDLLVEDDAVAAEVVRLPSLSWTMLARTKSEPEVIFRVWSRACDAALIDDVARARALLDDDTLRLDAADHPQLAVCVLLRIGALAWRTPETPEPLLETYRRAVPQHHHIDTLFEGIAIDLEAARAVGGRPFREPLKALPELLAFARNGNPAQRRDVADRMLRALGDDMRRGIDNLVILNRRREFMPIFELLYLHLDPAALRLERLTKPTFDRLTERLHAAGRERYKWPAIGIVTALAILVGVLVHPGIGASVIMVAIVAFLFSERLRYRLEVRPALARVLLDVPVTTEVVARWIRINGKLAGRLSRFDQALEADGPLCTFSLLSAAAQSIGASAED